jgi:hypothetical protein
MASTIEREIRFYRVDTGFDSSGKPKSFNPTPTFEHIKKLKFNDTPKSNYWDDNGKITGCWVYDPSMPCKISLGSIRRSDFPLVENQGELSPLEIPEKAGLVEQTHIVFLGDGIVGCDINFFGPRISRLAYFLAEKAIGVAPEILNFNPILRRDVYQQLLKLQYLRLFKLKIRSSYTDTIADIDDSLAAALRSARNAGGDSDIEIELILRTPRRSMAWLKPSLLETVKTLSKRPEIQYEIDTLKVTGYSPEQQKNIELDLLSDKLIIKREILKVSSKSRALNQNSAFKAIISAYEEIKDEINNSPSIAP